MCVREREREREREGKLMAARMKKVYPGADLKPQNKQYEIESIHHRPPDGKFVFCHFFLFLSLSLSLPLSIHYPFVRSFAFIFILSLLTLLFRHYLPTSSPPPSPSPDLNLIHCGKIFFNNFQKKESSLCSVRFRESIAKY